MSVVFPEPLGPIMAYDFPERNSTSIPFSACSRPKFFLSCWMEIISFHAGVIVLQIFWRYCREYTFGPVN